MWWLVQRLREDPGPLHFGAGHVGHYVQALVTIAGIDQHRWVVQIPDDPQILAKMRAMPGADVLPASRVRPFTVPAVTPTTTDPSTEAATLVAYLRTAALKRGWSEADLEATGVGGDPGAGGGRSARAGLALAEMALVQPPSDWADLSARGRPPWESTMWTAPGPTWRPPSWAPMPAPVAAIDPEIPAETFTAPVVDDVADEAEDDEPEPAAPTPPQADALDLAEWEGTEDQLAEVIAIVLDLRQRQGKTPHVNAVSYHLRRANLPTVTTKQIEAICTRGAP